MRVLSFKEMAKQKKSMLGVQKALECVIEALGDTSMGAPAQRAKCVVELNYAKDHRGSFAVVDPGNHQGAEYDARIASIYDPKAKFFSFKIEGNETAIITLQYGNQE